ncbi:hypothetical protein OC844_006463 [Tilletia horrida]|nr:hypothetical protein OC844_006463 [Tilletia horrida]
MSLAEFLNGAQATQSGWKATLVDLQTASTISGARLQLDALRVARSLVDGGLLPRGSGDADRTVLLHLPNSLPFVTVLLGAVTAGATVVLADPELDEDDLEALLRKVRPQVIVTSVSGAGEDRIGAAVGRILSSPAAKDASFQWAQALAASHRLAATTRLHPSELAPFKHRRIWTVNPVADYYGSSFLLRVPTAPAPVYRTDSQDWTALLLPPSGHKHAGNQDFDQVQAMAITGQPRLPFQAAKSAQPASSAAAIVTYEAGRCRAWSHAAAIDAVRAIGRHEALKASSSSRAGPWLSMLPWTTSEGLFGQVLSALTSDACLLIVPRPPVSQDVNASPLVRLLSTQGTSLAHARTLEEAELVAKHAADGGDLPHVRAIAVAEDTPQTEVGGLPLLSLTRLLAAPSTGAPSTGKSRL